MGRALLTMILLGVAIGSALPVARPRAAAPPPIVANVDRPVATVLERRESGHFLTVADVNGEPVPFVVDTGADVVALTTDDARRAHVVFDPAEFTVVAHGASGDVRGQQVRLQAVSVDGKRVSDITGVVLADSPVSLLGQTYLRHLDSVEIRGDTMTLR